MSQENLVEIVCIIDKSGSMEMVKGDAIGGFNSFLTEQKKEKGKANMTLVLFDTNYDMRFDCVDIGRVEPFTEKSYDPSGATALLDAIGRTLDSVGKRLAGTAEGERPRKVIVAILTDGEENSSTDFTKARINEMIKLQRETYKWEFIFLAANQDAIGEAVSMGMGAHQAINFAHTGEGMRGGYTGMSNLCSTYRSSGD